MSGGTGVRLAYARHPRGRDEVRRPVQRGPSGNRHIVCGIMMPHDMSVKLRGGFHPSAGERCNVPSAAALTCGSMTSGPAHDATSSSDAGNASPATTSSTPRNGMCPECSGGMLTRDQTVPETTPTSVPGPGTRNIPPRRPAGHPAEWPLLHRLPSLQQVPDCLQQLPVALRQ